MTDLDHPEPLLGNGGDDSERYQWQHVVLPDARQIPTRRDPRSYRHGLLVADGSGRRPLVGWNWFGTETETLSWTTEVLLPWAVMAMTRRLTVADDWRRTVRRVLYDCLRTGDARDVLLDKMVAHRIKPSALKPLVEAQVLACAIVAEAALGDPGSCLVRLAQHLPSDVVAISAVMTWMDLVADDAGSAVRQGFRGKTGVRAGRSLRASEEDAFVQYLRDPLAGLQ